jgi:hypothetical protein
MTQEYQRPAALHGNLHLETVYITGLQCWFGHLVGLLKSGYVHSSQPPFDPRLRH